MKGFRERLQNNEVVVFDGGVGTYLYEKGIFINTCFDELNITNPDIVSEVHRDYVAAGADVIETNTFGANRFKLAPHGLEPKVYEINLKGAQLAKAAAGGRSSSPAPSVPWASRSSRSGSSRTPRRARRSRNRSRGSWTAGST